MFSLTSLWLLLILRLSHHPFSCTLTILQWTRYMGYRLMITSISSPPCYTYPQAYGTEVSYCPSLDLNVDNLLDQGYIPEIWNKGYNFRLMEQIFIENKTQVSEPYTGCLAISTSLGKIEDRREGGNRGIINSIGMHLSKFWEIAKDREAWLLQSMGSQRLGHDLATEQQTALERYFCSSVWN